MDLVDKYNIAAPRYTSYPTVPAWNTTPSEEDWKLLVKQRFTITNARHGISLYIHLPFCESLCTYCACNTRITVNHKVEEPYLETILKEWQLYCDLFEEKPKIKEIHLGGGTPTFFSPKNLKSMMLGIIQNAEICEEHDFSFEGHPNNTSAEHLQTLFDLGFRRVSFGIQDFDPQVQDVINRYQSLERVQQVVDDARRIGYSSVNFDLVYGLPLQKLATIEDTIKKVISLKPDRIAFYSYAHVPWLRPGQRKYTEMDLPAGAEKRKLYESGYSLFSEAGYKDIGMDHFSLESDSLYKSMQQKKLHRNFMGYTEHFTELMISLGTSSISDTGNAFAQNIKVVEHYQQTVEQGKFPIFKGHILSKEDESIRKHILNIMCKGETEWVENNVSDTFKEGLMRCEALQQDGLVQIFPEKIIVTPLGKSFLRNICMAFDAYYWKNKETKPMFSAAV